MKIIIFICIILTFSIPNSQAQTVPEDSPFPSQKIRDKNESLNSFTAYPWANVWFVAATPKYTVTNDGYVMMDYYKVFEIDKAGNKRIVDEDYFDTPIKHIPSFQGGLCTRIKDPEKKDFCTLTVEDLDNAYISKGNFVVFAGKHGRYWNRRWL